MRFLVLILITHKLINNYPYTSTKRDIYRIKLGNEDHKPMPYLKPQAKLLIKALHDYG